MNRVNRESIMPPIIVVDGGDIDIYNSVEEVLMSIEAIDVIAEVYQIFDSRGRVLEARAESETAQIRIVVHRTESDPEQLFMLLKRFAVAAHWSDVDELEKISLESLVELIQDRQKP